MIITKRVHNSFEWQRKFAWLPKQILEVGRDDDNVPTLYIKTVWLSFYHRKLISNSTTGVTSWIFKV